MTAASYCIKGRIQQNPSPCGTDPVLTACPQVPASQGRAGLQPGAMQLAFPPAGGKPAQSFLLWEFNGKLPLPTWEEVVGRALAHCCSLGFPNTKLWFFKASARGRSTHVSSAGIGCCIWSISVLPSSLISGCKPCALLSSPHSHDIQMSPNHLC